MIRLIFLFYSYSDLPYRQLIKLRRRLPIKIPCDLPYRQLINNRRTETLGSASNLPNRQLIIATFGYDNVLNGNLPIGSFNE